MNRHRGTIMHAPMGVKACQLALIVGAKARARAVALNMALGPALSLALTLPAGVAQAQPQPQAQPPVSPSAPSVGSPSAQAALEILLNSTTGQPGAAMGTNSQLARPGGPGPSMAAAASGDSAGRVMVTVARGQTLDMLLRQHLAASPLRVELLRELVRQLNPRAFAPGAGYRLVAGARLQLPSSEDQLQHAFGKSVGHRDGATDPGAGSAAAAAAAARRGWVRYP